MDEHATLPETMTEQQFIEKFKQAGFDLYKTEDLKRKLDAYYAFMDVVNNNKDKAEAETQQ